MAKRNKISIAICLALIMLTWIIGGQELYWNRHGLHTVVAARYAIYFIWLAVVACIGAFSFKGYANNQLVFTWLSIYGVVIGVFLAIGVLDISLLHLTHDQKQLIQTFRLFFQSPVPFVMFHLLLRVVKASPSHLQKFTAKGSAQHQI